LIVKKTVLRLAAISALTVGGALTMAAPAQAGWYSHHNYGWNNGNQSSYVFQAPVNICGNSIAILGFATSSCRGGAYAYNGR
jgi:hypothetical protein